MKYQELVSISQVSDSESFYLYDERKFEQNYRDFTGAFSSHYSNLKIGFSYKTNYVPSIARQGKDMGALAEVVSFMELRIAEAIGYSGSDIIFNGPFKTTEELKYSLSNNVLVNIDSYQEFLIIKSIVESENIEKCRLGVRCNFEIIENTKSRFGVDVNKEEFWEIIDYLKTNNSLIFEGIHCHFSTRSRSIDSFEQRVRKMFEIYDRIGIDLSFIDIGGGYFGKMDEDKKSGFEFPIPSFEEYADSIGRLFKEKFPKEDVTMILEPGAALLADTVCFYSKVHAIKRFSNNRSIAILDGSYQNIRPMGNGSKLPAQIISSDMFYEHFDQIEFSGYTCMEFDYMAELRNAKVAVGDYLEFKNVGAYTIVLKAPFINLNYPIISTNGESYNVIKRKETINDILSTYIF